MGVILIFFSCCCQHCFTVDSLFPPPLLCSHPPPLFWGTVHSQVASKVQTFLLLLLLLLLQPIVRFSPTPSLPNTHHKSHNKSLAMQLYGVEVPSNGFFSESEYKSMCRGLATLFEFDLNQSYQRVYKGNTKVLFTHTYMDSEAYCSQSAPLFLQ